MATTFSLGRTSTTAADDTIALAYASAVTAGATLFCIGGDDAADVAMTCADSVNGAWTEALDVAKTHPQTSRFGLWYYEGTGAGTPTVTITLASSPTAAFIWIGQISASGTLTFTSIINTDLDGQSTAVVPDAGDLTPTESENFIVACHSYGWETKNGLLSGWTQGGFDEASIGWYIDTVYITDNALSARECTMDHDGASSTGAASLAALFEVATGGGGGNPWYAYAQQ